MVSALAVIPVITAAQAPTRVPPQPARADVTSAAGTALPIATRAERASHARPVDRIFGGYGRIPLHFEPNRGQAPAEAEFVSRGTGYSIYLTASGHEFPFAFMIPFVYLFNIIDAWKGANAANARFLGGRAEAEEQPEVESPVWGGSLVLLGVLILLSNLGWLDIDRLARWWPVLLIAVGGYFVYNSLEARKASGGSAE